MPETPDQRWTRVQAQKEKDRLRMAVHRWPVEDCHAVIDGTQVHRLTKAPTGAPGAARPTRTSAQGARHLKRAHKGESWEVEAFPQADAR